MSRLNHLALKKIINIIYRSIKKNNKNVQIQILKLKKKTKKKVMISSLIRREIEPKSVQTAASVGGEEARQWRRDAHVAMATLRRRSHWQPINADAAGYTCPPNTHPHPVNFVTDHYSICRRKIRWKRFFSDKLFRVKYGQGVDFFV